MRSSTTPKTALSTLVLLASLGCALKTEQGPELEPEPRSNQADQDTHDILQAATCTPDHRIAFVPGLGGGPCPAATYWIPSTLFLGSMAALGNYCLYDYDHLGAPPFSPALSPLSIDAITTDHAADCNVVLTQDDGSSPGSAPLAYEPMLRDALHDALNRLDADELDLLHSESGRSAVQIAIVDTIPTEIPDPPYSRHGEDMASFAEDIACPAGDGATCAVDVRYALGLPLRDDGEIDFVNGGVRGAHRHLAQAIYDAVKAAPANTKRIINLSVGWDTSIYGGPGHGEPTNIRAVRAALEHAYCHGAIIIAAAGNSTPSCTTGPLSPGAFEQWPAPDAARCAELGAPSLMAPASYRPLVYAVGGVDFGDTTPPSMDRGGMPRLAATAKHAVPGTLRLPVTGTSVSAAVTSGTAALLWSFFPGMSSTQIMQTIYDGATTLESSADFTGPGDDMSTTVRRLNICSAFALAQTKHTGALTTPLTCPTPSPETLLDFSFGYETADDPTSMTFASTVETPCEVSCIEGFEQPADGFMGPTCPDPEPIVDRYFRPQPSKPPCPRCVIATNDGAAAEAPQLSIYAALHEDYEGYAVEGVNVTLYEGDTPTRLRLGAISLSTDSTTRIDLGISPTELDIRAAEIELLLSKAGEPGESGTSERRSNDLLLDLP
ncbi:MAG: S8/S53 family peptidase [Myxococcota bacterium]